MKTKSAPQMIKRAVAILMCVVLASPVIIRGEETEYEPAWLTLEGQEPHQIIDGFDDSYDPYTFWDNFAVEDYSQIRLNDLLNRMTQFGTGNMTMEEISIIQEYLNLNVSISDEEFYTLVYEYKNYIYQSTGEQAFLAFSTLLTSGRNFSSLTEADRSLIFRQVGIAANAQSKPLKNPALIPLLTLFIFFKMLPTWISKIILICLIFYCLTTLSRFARPLILLTRPVIFDVFGNGN